VKKKKKSNLFLLPSGGGKEKKKEGRLFPLFKGEDPGPRSEKEGGNVISGAKEKRKKRKDVPPPSATKRGTRYPGDNQKEPKQKETMIADHSTGNSPRRKAGEEKKGPFPP